jgi:hypothetical protein
MSFTSVFDSLLGLLTGVLFTPGGKPLDAHVLTAHNSQPTTLNLTVHQSDEEMMFGAAAEEIVEAVVSQGGSKLLWSAIFTSWSYLDHTQQIASPKTIQHNI